MGCASAFNPATAIRLPKDDPPRALYAHRGAGGGTAGGAERAMRFGERLGLDCASPTNSAYATSTNGPEVAKARCYDRIHNPSFGIYLCRSSRNITESSKFRFDWW
jgi:hypothetical protein